MTADGDGDAPPAAGASERIAKRIARAGLCSRRDAERWIGEGRVRVDGLILTTPAVIVTGDSRIEVDGAPLPEAAAARLFRFHKPRGYLTAARDPEGRKTIADLMPLELPRLMPIGRLDMGSEGLLLLTNDGALKRQLELPATGWQRRYRVRVHGEIDERKLAALAAGITIDGFDYGPIEAGLERVQGSNAWLTVALREGKNREIRRVMEHFGWPVSRLIRVSFGPFHLGNLPESAVEEIKTKVVKEQLGLVLRPRAAPAGGRKTRRSARPTAGTPAAAAAQPKAAKPTAKPAPRARQRLTLRAGEPTGKAGDGERPAGDRRRRSRAPKPAPSGGRAAPKDGR